MSEEKTEIVNKKSLLEKLVPVFLVLTIGLSFLVGVLWQKVNSLSVSGGTTAGSAQKVTGPKDWKIGKDQVSKIPEVTAKDHVRGSLTADIYIVEYSDLECPFCKKFHPVVVQALDAYNGKIAWVYRHFPIDFLHSKARNEAEASECVASLAGEDIFWKYIDKIYEVTPANNNLEPKMLSSIAKELGVNLGNFSSCLKEGKFKDKITESIRSGDSAGVTGTPGVFVLNKKGEGWVVPGAVPYETLKAIIEEALKN